MNICRKCGKREPIMKVLNGYGPICGRCRENFSYAAIVLRTDRTMELVPASAPVMDETDVMEKVGSEFCERVRVSEKIMPADSGTVIVIDETGKIIEPMKPLNEIATVLYGRITADNRMKDFIVGDAVLMSVAECDFAPHGSTHMYSMEMAEDIYAFINSFIIPMMQKNH